VSADGGWAGVDAAAARVVEDVRAAQRPGDAAVLVGLPSIKPDDAMRFPLERRGLVLAGAGDAAPASAVVTVVCDPLFDAAVGSACGGEAEAAWLAGYPERDRRLVGRFAAGSRRVISVYAPGG
jgi:hypothetical protein